jgi:hypothetical protein
MKNQDTNENPAAKSVDSIDWLDEAAEKLNEACRIMHKAYKEAGISFDDVSILATAYTRAHDSSASLKKLKSVLLSNAEFC